ncbi:BCCT family transporter [Kiritimatiella glycovorans]|nr:BCCT family transporter [Kiritimatiella glycovorans]
MASSDSGDGGTVRGRRFDVHPPVFWPSLILILLFIALTLLVGAPMEKIFSSIQEGIAIRFGWFFVLAVNFYLLFTLYLAFSRFGTLRLGGPDAVPDFGRTSWFAMLFSAGMGIGILFWSVAEPLSHYVHAPTAAAETEAAARAAMRLTFLHWGLHAWGVYALVGLALAFFAFNRRQPISIRSVFYPLLGNRAYRWPGHLIDVVAVAATLFGLATSLGFGVRQMSSGFHFLFGWQDSLTLQLVLIALITAAATLSVASGIDHGVKRLSELNIYTAAVLMIFLAAAGPTLFILDGFVQNTGSYLQHFFELSFWTETYAGDGWQHRWTIFYWSWWISWSPFVGMFIARISRGRTVREFVLSVLIVPALLTFFWISVFGGAGLYLELHEGADIARGISNHVATSLYALFEHFPFTLAAQALAVLLVMSFFVTSADSGSLVVDAFTSGGKLDTPIFQRVLWALLAGAVAAVLLVGGGIGALQTAAVSTGLPFAAVLIGMGWSLRRGLIEEREREALREREEERRSYEDLVRDLVAGGGREEDTS